METRLIEKANKLPLLPGVYIMRDLDNRVIYVGKAKKLKNRVSSYFHGEHLPKVTAMIEKVSDFEVVVVNSEFEALVLENSLIKRYMPHYNILLKDDKGYPFVRLSQSNEYPTFSVVNHKKDDNAVYFGPFGGRRITFNILETIKKALLLPTCSRKFPRDIGKERPCLNFQLGLCAGYCRKEASPEEYLQSVNQMVMVLSGKITELYHDLMIQMEIAADELRFEAAAEIRDRMRALQSLNNRQNVIATTFADTDAIGFFRGEKTGFVILHYSEGNLVGKDFMFLDEPLESNEEVMSTLILQYYSGKVYHPQYILLPFEIEAKNELSDILSESAGHLVKISVPLRGKKLALTETACINAREDVLRNISRNQRQIKVLELLQKTINLPTLPRRIEAFDISNIGPFDIVAAMSVFVDGKPLKKDYRKYRIKTVSGQDDYGSMNEAVTRRFLRYLNGDIGFSNLPDLLLIDGGRNHVAIADEALHKLGISLPVLGMVKNDNHRTRALVTSDGKEIGISSNQAVYAFIGKVQEETHRIAIEYHRSLRSNTIMSTLKEIPGIGEKRCVLLLKEFKSLKTIQNASIESLSTVLPINAANAVYNYFHGEDNNKCASLQDLQKEEN